MKNTTIEKNKQRPLDNAIKELQKIYNKLTKGE